MKFTAPLSSVTEKPCEAIRIIADNLIKTRPVAKVAYRPVRKSNVYVDWPGNADPITVDLKVLYPEAKPGNVVYVSTVFDSSDDALGAIRMFGKAKIFIDGKCVFDAYSQEPSPDGRYSYSMNFKKGPHNPVTFMLKCESEDSFKFKFMPSVRQYWMWARWYLLNVLAKSPIPEYEGEEGLGISRLYESEEPFDGKYVYPEVNGFGNRIDFAEIYPEEKGRIAYAVTYALEDTEISLKCPSKHSVIVNGIETASERLKLSEGDVVMLKVLREYSWSFEFSGENIGIPNLESKRTSGDKWITLASFSKSGNMRSKHGPEYGIQFTKPYINACGETVFWKLAGKDDYVRPYLQSRFFGQWFYALMVGTHGLLRAAEALDEPEYKEYFVNSSEIMTTYYDYIRYYDRKTFNHPSFIEASAFLRDLDSIGSMGRNLCELYNIHPTTETLHVIEELAKAAKYNIPRFEDGTYHRPRDMWSDDMFMSCPFIVRLGNVKQDNYYYEEAIRQFMGFKKRLYMKDEQIMSHIFFLDTNEPNNIPWGRGNGWVYVAISDALENIPEGFEGRDKLIDFYLDFTKGITRLQDSDGLWHQVLNRADSYQETSCTGMFMLGLCRGIKNGWIDRETYMPYVMRAYHGLIDKKISSTGNVYDVCMGSSNSKQVEYYMNLGAVDNDDHGTGVILTAFTELMKIL